MPVRAVGAAALLAAAVAGAGCDEPPNFPTAALSAPVDFAYACETVGGTTAPSLDERTEAFSSTTTCPALPDGSAARMFGVVASQHPGVLNVLQIGASAASAQILDADAFRPGVSGVPVGTHPIRVLTASDWGSFFVVAAGGGGDVTRVTLLGLEDGIVQWRSARFPLPGVPADAVMVDQRLVVAPAHAPELWVYDLLATPDAPPLTALALDAVPHALEPIAGTDLVVMTFRDETRVAVLSLDDGSIVASAGLGPACSNGADDDGDGLVDRDDPDCASADDPDESGGRAARPDATTPAVAAFEGQPSCADELDNDGDGLTDFPLDPGCVDAKGSELTPECGDGLDNDGDGLADADDPSCYSPDGRRESVPAQPGPFLPAVVDARDAGLGVFLYVLDQPRAVLHVLSVTDGAGGSPDLAADPAGGVALEPVRVHAEERLVAELAYTEYGDPGQGDTLREVRHAAKPTLDLAGETALRLGGTQGAAAVAATRTRGELWTRLVAPASAGQPAEVARDLGDASGLWKPTGCDPADDTTCLQPAGDGDSWVLMVPRLDGTVAVVEAIRRGVPTHRLSQSSDAPRDRGVDIPGRPTLSLRGQSVALGTSLREGFPFPGPRTEEDLVAVANRTDGTPCVTDSDCGQGVCRCVDEACDAEVCDTDPVAVPRRRWGIWPPADPEQATAETWDVSYEGVLPGTFSRVGRVSAEPGGGALELFDPTARFCELGAEVGDWLTLRAPTGAMAPELHLEVSVVTDDGVPCPLEAPLVQEVEARIVQVGRHTLALDGASARRRPLEPTLDEEAIEASDEVTLSGCREARDELLARLTWADALQPVDGGLEAAQLPERFWYEVRPDGAWTVVGSRSGYVHRWAWDAEAEGGAGACVLDETLDPRLTARVTPTPFVEGAAYELCPPATDQIGLDALETFFDVSGRYEGVSFGLDMLPACETLDDGTIALPETQRDTRWRFTTTGPSNSAVLRLSGAQHPHRARRFDVRRWQMVLDAAGQRAYLVEARADGRLVRMTFE